MRSAFSLLQGIHLDAPCMYRLTWLSAFIVTEKDIGFEDLYKRISNGYSIISQA